jgi:uncharacterized protein DUF5655/uncharacterized protein DUF4287
MPPSSAQKSQSLYDIHPTVAMVQKWVALLKSKTGRSLNEWLALIKKEAPKDEKSRRAWLKSRHKLGTNTAWWLAERVDRRGTIDSDSAIYLSDAAQYVEQQYAGPKASLRPIYDLLLVHAKSLSPDVKACPCKTIVPLYRSHVFAQLKATTNSRLDLGLCLKHHKGKLPKRLVDTGGLAKNDRITHRIELKSVAEIDDEAKKWLKIAFDLDQ